MRLSINSLAGTARTLVAVGIPRLVSMLATVRADAPRNGAVSALALSFTACSGAGVGAGAGLAGVAVGGGVGFVGAGWVAGLAGPGWAAARSPAIPAMGAVSSEACSASAAALGSDRAGSADVLTAASLFGWSARWSPSDCSRGAVPEK